MSTSLRVDILFGLAHHPDVRVRRVSQALSEAGHSVRILAWDRGGALPPREMDGEVRVERVRVTSRHGRGWTQVFFLAVVLIRFARRIRQDRPDVLHAVDLPMLVGALLIRPFAGPRMTVVFDAFEIFALMESRKYPRPVIKVIEMIERWAPRAADVVITPGSSRQAYFADRGVPSVVVANWIDPTETEVTRSEARRALDIEEGRFAIAYAGSLLRSRDVKSLIDHARRAPNDLVLIAGRGPAEHTLKKQADDVANVRFLGWLPDPSILYAAIDALYYSLVPDHPYAAEAAPNNLYVAIAESVPLVYRPQGEIAVVASQHRIGESFEDERSLDAAIDLLRHRSENRAIRTSLCSLQAKYSWSRAKETLLDAYGKISKTVKAPRTRDS